MSEVPLNMDHTPDMKPVQPFGPDSPKWTDWREQMRRRVRTGEEVARHIRLTPSEALAIEETRSVFHFSVTPYYLSLIDPDDENCPIRRQVIPRMEELDADIVGAEDPLEEVAHSPVKNLIHNYPDRVAFCVTSECAIYCRFCLRKRMVGDSEFMMRRSELDAAVAYIRSHPEIRDVLLTGGDPLVLSDTHLDRLLTALRAIDHVEVIRIGSRMPVKLPYRITDGLCEILARHGPVWLNTHFNHPSEITPAARQGINRLVSHGIPVGNQTVLLRGINDDTGVMKRLCEQLVHARVRPYYLYQGQLIGGTAHLRTPIETGLEIMASLQGRTTGFAIPRYVLDTPFGKVPLDGSWLVGRFGMYVVMRTTRGTYWAEPNPKTGSARDSFGLRDLDPEEIPDGTMTLVNGRVALLEIPEQELTRRPDTPQQKNGFPGFEESGKPGDAG